MFAGLYTGIGSEVVNQDLARNAATQNGADASGGKNDAGTGSLVVNEEDLRGVGEDVTELADDAIGRDNGLVGLEAIL